MSDKPQFYLVDATALPEIFLKVAEVKRLLSTGTVLTVHEATQQVGISRSAFYKYRDAILPFHDIRHNRVITFQFMLRDQAGMLASILQLFAQLGANILTINSIIPSDGCALVTISAETTHLTTGLDEMMDELSQVPGVIKAQIMAA